MRFIYVIIVSTLVMISCNKEDETYTLSDQSSGVVAVNNVLQFSNDAQLSSTITSLLEMTFDEQKQWGKSKRFVSLNISCNDSDACTVNKGGDDSQPLTNIETGYVSSDQYTGNYNDTSTRIPDNKRNGSHTLTTLETDYVPGNQGPQIYAYYNTDFDASELALICNPNGLFSVGGTIYQAPVLLTSDSVDVD
ncbi:hypothetical protein [Saccharicrinis aurantiacus]|uniref:hypothetical protein n=1 Tax=Saccharicrinis aurantiacus TaxID=1849719 RepID=UPI002490B98E|nr:hypothetical protein [Saccharicrinis aurantiacus]